VKDESGKKTGQRGQTASATDIDISRRTSDTDSPHCGFSLFPSDTSLSILFVGDASRPEFHDSRTCLGKWGIVTEYSNAELAATAMAEDRISPDVIVVAQAFPGHLSHEAIDRLRRLAPLARVIGLMGSWCEGEMRSGSPWPATVRTYWHQWPARGDRQFRLLTTGQSCSWALPLTATEEERLLADAVGSGGTPTSISSSAQVVIRSQSREMVDWLSAACLGRGFASTWQRDSAVAPLDGAAIGVFDGSDLCDYEYDALSRFVIALRPVPVVALLSFPRIEDHDRALSAGALAVLSKPLLVEDLLSEIR
jgi:DNA-binding NarL/FixJ family response regulator